MTDILAKAFNSADFEETGLSLIRFLSNTFEQADNRVVLPYKTPEEQYEYWKEDFGQPGSPIHLFKDVVEKSILYHHPHYMGIKRLFRRSQPFYLRW